MRLLLDTCIVYDWLMGEIKNQPIIERIQNEAQVETLSRTPDDLSGEAMEELLLRDYKLSGFALLAAKARAFQLRPFNASNFLVSDKAFEKLD